MNKNFLKFIAIVFWIVVWWVIAKMANTFILPSPNETLKALYHIVLNKGFLAIITASLARIIIGFIISSIIGLVLGVLAGLCEKFEIFINPIITVIKSIPVISLILIILFWVKSDITPLVVCFLMCLPVMYNNIYDGIKNVDSNLINMATLYKMSKLDMIKNIYFHSIKPYLFAATKTCLNLGFRVTVAAEVLSNPKYGLGTQLFDSKIYLNMADLFAYTVIIVTLSYIFEVVLKYIIKKNTLKGVIYDVKH